MRAITLLLVSALVLLPTATACSHASGGSGRPPARYDANVISAEEIERSGAENVLVLVHTLRPNWLRGRGSTSVMAEGTLVAYLDGSRLGGPEVLRSVTTQGIAMVRFYDAPSATIRFGTGHSHGAIQIVSLVVGGPQ